MIKLNRATEYGLVALRHMNKKRRLQSSAVTSAREVSDCYGLPFEITAKTLQRLKDTGLISSAHGSRGGYTLQKSLEEISLAEFLQLMEGRRVLVACAPGHAEGKKTKCEYHGKCEIKGLMAKLNQKVLNFLSGIKLAELAEGRLEEESGEEQ